MLLLNISAWKTNFAVSKALLSLLTFPSYSQRFAKRRFATQKIRVTQTSLWDVVQFHSDVRIQVAPLRSAQI